MKKVIIIGGGISGIVAGIYAQKYGFQSEIYEKNVMLGGECTGWNRQGYWIDNCIHWLTGCREEDAIYQIWTEIGAISSDTVFYCPSYVYKMEMDGIELCFWLDLNRARKEFLEVAPEDTSEINKFFDSVKKAECIKIPVEKSQADMSMFDFMKFGFSMMDMQSVLKEYGKQTVEEFSERFKNKYVRNMMKRYFNKNFLAFTLITSYAFYSSGMGRIPEGGSRQMVERMTERYKQLGGRIFTKMTASKINIENSKVKSVMFNGETNVTCDYLISAIDINHLFSQLLDEKYMDKKLKTMYEQKDGYKLSSIFNVSFGVIGEQGCSIHGSVIFPCVPYKVGLQTCDFLGVRMYDYDKTIFPKGKYVIQCSILQDEDDYEFWGNLYADRAEYSKEKIRIAKEVEERVIQHYPELENRLILLDTYSPITFTKWCNAYKGAYMSFYEQSGYKSLTAKNTIHDVPNIFLAGQWLNTNGGLPIAATNGVFAVKKMLKAESNMRK